MVSVRRFQRAKLRASMASHEHLRIFILLTIAASFNLTTSARILENIKKNINMESIEGPIKEDSEQKQESGRDAALANTGDASQDAIFNTDIHGIGYYDGLDSLTHLYNNTEDRRGKNENVTNEILKEKDNDAQMEVTEINENGATRGKRSIVSHSDWMSRVDGSLHLNHLSIPGTHDTMAYQSEQPDYGGMIHCQDQNLYTQLLLGIRYLDIRLSDSLSLFHGSFYLKSSLYDVLDTLEQFLQRHPTETVIFRYKKERNNDDVNRFRNKFNAAVKNKKSVIFGHDDGEIEKAGFPILDEVRGKIVILNYQAYDGCFGKNTKHLQMEKDNWETNTVEWDGTRVLWDAVKCGIQPQDGCLRAVAVAVARDGNGIVRNVARSVGRSVGRSVSRSVSRSVGSLFGGRRRKRSLGWVASRGYKEELRIHLEKAKSSCIKGENLDKLWLTWASAADVPKCGPKCIAKDVNPYLNSLEHLWNNRGEDYTHVGVVVLDFPTTFSSELPAKIYRRNFKGQNLWLSNERCGVRSLTSPNYPYSYPDNVHKPETLEARAGKRIQMTFTVFDVEADILCGYDYLKVTDSDGSVLMDKTCGDNKPRTLTSNTQRVTVLFHTDGSVRKKGFKIIWTSV